MDHIGHIESNDSSVPLTRDGWVALIGTTDDLTAVPPVESVNPFTRKPVEVHVPSDTVRMIHNGSEIACFSWAPTDCPYVNVSAYPDRIGLVIQRANELAQQLSGRFVRFDD
jgi:hypothetical protein